MPDISVVMPACNEEENIKKIIKDTSGILAEISDSQYEIIVVDDGSTDRTGEIIRHLIAEDAAIKLIMHEYTQGIGSCLRDGFSQAQCEWLTFLPADGQIDPSVLKKFVLEMQNVDLVTSFYIKKNRSVVRRIISRVLRMILFIFFGRHPRLEGIYMFKRKILDTVSLTSSTFVSNFELIVKAYRQGYKIKEIGIVCLPRLSGSSKVANLKTIFKVMREIIKWRING